MADFDPRITPAKPSLADIALKGQVRAHQFIAPKQYRVGVPVTTIKAHPNALARQVDQARFGEVFNIYEITGPWAWGQLIRGGAPGYVGYVEARHITHNQMDITHRVSALRAPVFTEPDLKSPISGYLSMGSLLHAQTQDGDYALMKDAGWVHQKHIIAVSDAPAPDYVSVAEQFLGLPYVWGGLGSDGVDCSGLVQISMEAAGAAAPRDSDQQQGIGTAIDVATADLQRGDLMFWKGHVGIMQSKTRLLHANAFHMKTASENLSEAVKRLKKSDLEIIAIRRP